MLKGLILAVETEASFRQQLRNEGLSLVQVEEDKEEGFQRALKELLGSHPDATASEFLCLIEKEEQERYALGLGIPCIGYLNPSLPEERLRGCSMLLEGFEEVDRVFLKEVHARSCGLPVEIAQTKRLVIREAATEDLEELKKLYEDVSPFLPREFQGSPKEEKEKLAAYQASMYGLYHFGMWLLRERESGRLIGRAGLEIAEYEENPRIALGYLIEKETRRKGYALEACQAILTYAWERLGIEEISAYIDGGNKASLCLIEKLGFEKKRRIDWQEGTGTLFCYRCHMDEEEKKGKNTIERSIFED